MRVIRAAVAGAGFIGPVHVEAVRRLGHQVVGILGSTPEKSSRAAQSLGLSKAYESFAELIADPEVEVVHIATPNRLHLEECRAALAAGKHVLCEKPLGMTTAETRELVELAARCPQLLTAVNYNIRFYPLCLEARSRIAAGQFGEVYHVTGSYLQDWLLHASDFNWRVLADEGGELRAVADIGTHLLDLAQFITGLSIEAVCSDLFTVHPVRQQPAGGAETFSASSGKQRVTSVAVPVTTDDYGSILVRFTSGARGCFTVSQVAAGRKNCLRLEIAGSGGSTAWNSEDPEVLEIGRRGQPNELLPRDAGLLQSDVQPYANYPAGHVEGFPDTFKQLVRAAYRSIETGSPNSLVPSFADGHREAALCEAILKSHRSRQWESVVV
jgi:predicted dehydrogenase